MLAWISPSNLGQLPTEQQKSACLPCPALLSVLHKELEGFSFVLLLGWLCPISLLFFF